MNKKISWAWIILIIILGISDIIVAISNSGTFRGGLSLGLGILMFFSAFVLYFLLETKEMLEELESWVEKKEVESGSLQE